MKPTTIAIKLLLLALAIGICGTAFSEGSTAWTFDWLMLGADLAGLAFMIVWLPSMVDKPVYRGTVFGADLLPAKCTWPVWLFWLGLAALVFHAGCATRNVFAGESFDYHALRSVLISAWLLLAYQGKFKRWRSAEAQGHICGANSKP